MSKESSSPTEGSENFISVEQLLSTPGIVSRTRNEDIDSQENLGIVAEDLIDNGFQMPSSSRSLTKSSFFSSAAHQKQAPVRLDQSMENKLETMQQNYK